MVAWATTGIRTPRSALARPLPPTMRTLKPGTGAFCASSSWASRRSFPRWAGRPTRWTHTKLARAPPSSLSTATATMLRLRRPEASPAWPSPRIPARSPSPVWVPRAWSRWCRRSPAAPSSPPSLGRSLSSTGGRVPSPCCTRTSRGTCGPSCSLSARTRRPSNRLESTKVFPSCSGGKAMRPGGGRRTERARGFLDPGSAAAHAGLGVMRPTG
mmetsp:Transcript_42300/g.111892  ORF Transcript_42300/g.111892 Transcript_42300/m.111892 type:complete len:214 (-) Transcript_42300:50-691(-)